MTCVEVIKDWITKVSSEVSGIELVYGINRPLNYHVVLVKPSSRYNDEKYMALELAFSRHFYSLFPNEDFVITDNESIMEITELVMKALPIKQEVKEQFRFNYQEHNDNGSYEGCYALAA